MEEQNQTQIPVPKKKSRKKVLFILLGIILLIIILVTAGYFLFSNLNNSESDPGEPSLAGEEEADSKPDPTRTPTAQASYSCSGGKTIKASFYNEGDFPSVDVVMNNGEYEDAVLLYKTETKTGSKYVNADESVVLQISGKEAYVEEAGEKTYIKCNESS